MTLAEARRRVHALEARLSSPAAFYLRHRDGWLELASRITAETLIHLAAPDADPDEWRRAAENVAAQVTLAVFDAEGAAGAVFRTRDDSVELTLPHERGDLGAGAATGVSIEDIERWVQAGRAGVEDGKNLKLAPGEMDYGRSNLQIAWRVFNAIQGQTKESWSRLLGHVHDFVGAQHVEAMKGMQPQIEAVWRAMLVPVVCQDWQTWVAEQVRAV